MVYEITNNLAMHMRAAGLSRAQFAQTRVRDSGNYKIRCIQ